MKTVTRRWFVGLCVAAGLGAGACLSPTLPPLPPPAEPKLSYASSGLLLLEGVITAERSAMVVAVNNDNGELAGRVVRDGRYSFPLHAQPGDEIELWYEVGAHVSESLFLKAPQAAQPPDAGTAGAVPAEGAVPDGGAVPAAEP